MTSDSFASGPGEEVDGLGEAADGRAASVAADLADDSRLCVVIAFDPGGTTGWAVLVVWREAIYGDGTDSGVDYKIFDNIVFWAAGQYVGPEDVQADAMVDLVAAWPDDADIVVEDFVLRTFRMDRTLLAPVRVTSMFEHAVRWVGRKKGGRAGAFGYKTSRAIILQQPSLAMTTMTDERLKACGLYAPTAGKPHARDALRHAATRLRIKKQEAAYAALKRAKAAAALERAAQRSAARAARNGGRGKQ